MQTCAQVMLALDNLANQNQYTNTCSTFEALFAYDIVPVVNENDTVAVEELRFGDNDTLSAKVTKCPLETSDLVFCWLMIQMCAQRLLQVCKPVCCNYSSMICR